MTDERIAGGYILLPRTIFTHEISTMPLHYRWIWVYLIGKANHSEPTGNQRLMRGQVLVTLKELADACSYYSGYRKLTISRKDAWRVCEWYRGHDMIGTTKTTRGLVVTIKNYDIYQNPKNYGRDNGAPTDATTDGARTRQRLPHDRQELKNDKKKEEVAALPVDLDTPEFRLKWAEWEKYRKEIRKALKPTTRKTQLKKLAKMGVDKAMEKIDTAILHGWIGCAFEEKTNGTQTRRERSDEIAPGGFDEGVTVDLGEHILQSQSGQDPGEGDSV